MATIPTSDLLPVISRFPPVLAAFAYGSAAIPQTGYHPKTARMIDLILIVDDSKSVNSLALWHTDNKRRNPTDYSSFSHFVTSDTLARVQNNMGANMFYNTCIPLGTDGYTIKYGVISLSAALDDLYNWRHLYFAGRLQKPVLWLVPPSTLLQSAILSNIQSAVKVSYLLLTTEHYCQHPDTEKLFIKEASLYESISRLSYIGDFRMWQGAGENPQKIKNIVNGSFDLFRVLYSSTIFHCEKDGLLSIGNSTHNDIGLFVSPALRLQTLVMLPKCLIWRLIKINHNVSEASLMPLPWLQRLSTDPMLLNKCLVSVISRTVRGPAIGQAIKGVFTAGLVKAVSYSLTKIKKGRIGRAFIK